MTAHRIHTAGNARTHIVAHGYQSRPRVPGPIARPEGEPSLLAGVGLLVLIALAAVFAIAAVGV